MWHDTLNQFDLALSHPSAPVPIGINARAGRLDVYRNNIAVGLSKALAETFPIVKRLVGEEFFAGMAQIYVQKNRPASPVLFAYGSTFADFIETFAPARSLRYLADIARLERSWLDAYHSADISPLEIDVLATVSECNIENLRLDFHPSVHLIKSDHPVLSIWQAHQDADTPDLSVIPWQSEHVLITRPELDVRLIRLEPADFDFYTGLAAGGSLGAVCDALGNKPDFDPSNALARLFDSGAVIAINRNGETSA